jgi:hypothetical protein
MPADAQVDQRQRSQQAYAGELREQVRRCAPPWAWVRCLLRLTRHGLLQRDGVVRRKAEQREQQLAAERRDDDRVDREAAKQREQVGAELQRQREREAQVAERENDYSKFMAAQVRTVAPPSLV